MTTGLVSDEEGSELLSMMAVREEAARSLAVMARYAVREPDYDRNANRNMAIEVRDENGPLMEVRFTFETDKKQ